jgi:hypothetical protein
MLLAKKINKGAGTPAAPVDAQFNYVTMLLHGDGTNGAQNNTFLDSSTNNFTITRNGNTTQGSFSPYGLVGNWSTNFNGSSQNLYTPSTTALNVGSGNFTIECFFNVSAFNGANILRGGNQYNFALLLSGTSVIYYLSTTGSNWDLAGGLTAGSGLSAGTWNHLALVRNGNTFTPYLNGVAGTTSSSASALAVLNGFNIGAEQNGAAAGTFNGYISNVRVVVGTAVYTSNFTPPIAPLTAVSGTQLLACQNNRFIDNSSNNFTLTTAGTPSVQRFNPFGTSTAYSTSVIGGSGYFDGSGDYLQAPSGNAAFQFGTGDFTVECWIYQNATNNYPVVLEIDNHSTASGILFFAKNLTGTGEIGAYNGTVGFLGTVSGLALKTWNHIAWVRSSGTFKIYLNGVGNAGLAFTTNLNVSTPVTMGTNQAQTAAYDLSAYVSNLRVVKGTAVYTSNFTPPTAPLTAISGTSLLLSTTNGAIFDNAMVSNLETKGNSQISTSVVKYGTGSINGFSGGNNYQAVSYAGATVGNFGAGDFTVELWLNTNTANGAGILTQATDGGPANTSWGFFVGYASATSIDFYVSDASTYFANTGGGVINDSTWHHVAFSRSGSSGKLFVDGTQVGSTLSLGTTALGNGTLPINIGGQGNSGHMAQGYIDDVRITKGYARYTANFTPPIAAFSNTGPI